MQQPVIKNPLMILLSTLLAITTVFASVETTEASIPSDYTYWKTETGDTRTDQATQAAVLSTLTGLIPGNIAAGAGALGGIASAVYGLGEDTTYYKEQYYYAPNACDLRIKTTFYSESSRDASDQIGDPVYSDSQRGGNCIEPG